MPRDFLAALDRRPRLPPHEIEARNINMNLPHMDPVAALERLREALRAHPPGAVSVAVFEPLLAAAWPALEGGAHGGMDEDKVNNRTKGLSWKPPNLEFDIDRHGAAKYGSSRKEVQSWAVDVERGVATLVHETRRQLRRRSPDWDAKKPAASVAAAVRGAKDHDAIRWSPDKASFKVNLSAYTELIYGPKRTQERRRRKFREALVLELKPAGWVERSAHSWRRL